MNAPLPDGAFTARVSLDHVLVAKDPRRGGSTPCRWSGSWPLSPPGRRTHVTRRSCGGMTLALTVAPHGRCVAVVMAERTPTSPTGWGHVGIGDFVNITATSSQSFDAEPCCDGDKRDRGLGQPRRHGAPDRGERYVRHQHHAWRDQPDHHTGSCGRELSLLDPPDDGRGVLLRRAAALAMHGTVLLTVDARCCEWPRNPRSGRREVLRTARGRPSLTCRRVDASQCSRRHGTRLRPLDGTCCARNPWVMPPAEYVPTMSP